MNPSPAYQKDLLILKNQTFCLIAFERFTTSNGHSKNGSSAKGGNSAKYIDFCHFICSQIPSSGRTPAVSGVPSPRHADISSAGAVCVYLPIPCAACVAGVSTPDPNDLYLYGACGNSSPGIFHDLYCTRIMNGVRRSLIRIDPQSVYI